MRPTKLLKLFLDIIKRCSWVKVEITVVISSWICFSHDVKVKVRSINQGKAGFEKKLK